MSSKIDLPFLAGQDESWDKRILPSGPLAAVHNMEIDRNGRMVRRRELANKGTDRPAGLGKVDGDVVELVEDRGVIVERNGRKSVFRWTNETGSDGEQEEVLFELDGRVSKFDQASFFLSQENLGFYQTSPRASVDVDGRLFTSCLLDNEVLVLEVRDPDTYDVIFRIEYNDATEDSIEWANLFLSKTDRKGVITLHTVDQTIMVGFDTAPPYTFNTWREESFDTDANLAFVEMNLENSFLVWDGAGVFKRSFDDGSWEDISSGSILSTNSLRSIAVTSDDKRVALGFSEIITSPGGFAWTVYDTISWGVSSSGSGSTGGHGPASMQFIGDDLHVVAQQQISASFNYVYTRHYVFDTSEIAGVLSSNSIWRANLVNTGLVNVDGHLYCSTVSKENIFQITTPGPNDSWLASNTGTVNIVGLEPDRMSVSEASGPALVNNHRLPTILESSYEQYSIPVVVGDRVIFPITRKFNDSRQLKHDSMWLSYKVDQASGRSIINDRALVPGGQVSMVDSKSASPCGHLARPFIVDYFDTDIGQFLANSTYLISILFEWRDATGAVWQSAPTDSFQFITTFATATASVTVDIPLGVMGGTGGCKVVMYASAADETVLTRVAEVHGTPGTQVVVSSQLPGFSVTDDDPSSAVSGQEVLYTQFGFVGNDAPPSCSMVARTRDRVWAAGLLDPSRIQASKIIIPGQGIGWSDFDQYFVSFPEPVVGIAGIDNSLLVLTREATYAVNGEGPDDQANGSFLSPQTIPSTTGCISSKSILTEEDGVYYQSRRGIEILMRGFSAPKWIGEQVRDTISAFPVCLGGAVDSNLHQLKWLFGRDSDDETRAVIFDARATAWYVHQYDENPRVIGRNIGRVGAVNEAHVAFAGGSLSGVGYESIGTEVDGEVECFVETGSIRPSGLDAWMLADRMYLIGSYEGPCSVVIEMAFNGADYLPEHTTTWELGSEYNVGEEVIFEQTLPLQKFSSARFRLKFNKSSSDAGTSSFRPNGISLFFRPAPDGPRVPVRQKG